MNIRIALAAALALILSADFALSSGLTVMEEVVVEDAQVTLADLVEGSPITWHRVQLGSAPRPGKTSFISGKWIERKAAKVTDVSAITFPSRVKVTRAGQELESAQVQEAIADAVRRRHGSAIEVSVLKVKMPPTLPAGEVTLDVRLPRGKLPNRFTLPVTVMVDGAQRAKALAKVVQVQPVAEDEGDAVKVVTLARAVRKGDILRPEHLEMVESGRAGSGVLTDLSQALGLEARRSLSAGTQLKHSYLVAATVVEKNDIVRLVAKIGGIVATTSARVLEPAAVGEMVLVENVKSGRVLQGTVRQSGIVEVTSSFQEVN